MDTIKLGLWSGETDTRRLALMQEAVDALNHLTRLEIEEVIAGVLTCLTRGERYNLRHPVLKRRRT